MKPLLSRPHFALVGIGLALGLAVPVTAAPVGFVAPPSILAEASALDPTAVQPAVLTDDGGLNVIEVSRRGKSWGASRYYGKSRYYGRRHHHGHYRHYDNYWGSFAPGLLFGLGIASYRYYDPYLYYTPGRRVYRTYGLSRAHIAWCEDKYRSYRVSDNSFKPYHGPRRQCRSPYG